MGLRPFPVLLILANCLMQALLSHQNDFSAHDSLTEFLSAPTPPHEEGGAETQKPTEGEWRASDGPPVGAEQMLELPLREPCRAPVRVQHLLLGFMIHRHHNDRSCPASPRRTAVSSSGKRDGEADSYLRTLRTALAPGERWAN